MKKYVKPELFYERYELSQHIADCAWEMTYASEENCAAKGDEQKFGPGYTQTLFTATAACTIDRANYHDYCLTNGGYGVNVFIS